MRRAKAIGPVTAVLLAGMAFRLRPSPKPEAPRPPGAGAGVNFQLDDRR